MTAACADAIDEVSAVSVFPVSVVTAACADAIEETIDCKLIEANAGVEVKLLAKYPAEDIASYASFWL